ncbi:MAG: tetratricopeptide repeat protein [Bacteroidota bacterium]
MRSSGFLVYLLFAAMAALLLYCNKNTQPLVDSGYRNLSDTVEYVGMNSCIGCHAHIHHSFTQTGMGLSFDKATQEKTSATFDKHALVYDAKSNFYYKPYFRSDTLFIKEFRLDGKDTIHQRTEAISYIVGSGQHTNSHIVDFNGYAYQAPITFYTQDKKWDMAPGFEYRNQRFSRLLTSECFTCHNHYPEPVEGSINKFARMPTGIECERCHGPGEIHLKEKTAGILVDTAVAIDYSIVNPKDLPRDRQMDLCQRCHLQGVAVLEEGKSFYDFKPGMKLSNVLNVFLPRFSNTHEKFIMASQADRLQMSACYQSSEKLSCLSCHNPHHSVSSTPKSKFNNTCISCHGDTQPVVCVEAASLHDKTAGDCVSCHMPSSGSIDIPHVHITDHYISRQTARRALEIDTAKKAEVARFLGLQMMTKKNPKSLEMAKGYIATFDKYIESSILLDSAQYYLERSDQSDKAWFKTKVHYHFARQEFEAIRQMATDKAAQTLEDAWTAYRIGEAFHKSGNFQQALPYLSKAVDGLPYHLDFQEKLGNAYVGLKRFEEAEKVYRFVIGENDKRKVALCNLGFVLTLKRQFQDALQLYDRALALDPDYVQALLNKAALMQFLNRKSEANRLAARILKIQPDHARAKAMLGLESETLLQ